MFNDVKPQWVEIDINSIRIENCLDFGGPWLGLELLKKLGLPELFDKLMPAGREDVPWLLMAQILAVARLCDSSSELLNCILPNTFTKTLRCVIFSV
ncbi:MAG: hypothetical protein H8E17_15190 [Deltaproteobacteria bacterium]|nr:hypothetical protein [Deltaproteobacteria bacterium]